MIKKKIKAHCVRIWFLHIKVTNRWSFQCKNQLFFQFNDCLGLLCVDFGWTIDKQIFSFDKSLSVLCESDKLFVNHLFSPIFFWTWKQDFIFLAFICIFMSSVHPIHKFDHTTFPVIFKRELKDYENFVFNYFGNYL